MDLTLKSRDFRSSGFSLLEVMIALGIVLIISLGTASLLSNMMHAQKGVQNSAEITDYVSAVAQQIDTGSCLANLQAAMGSGTALPSFTIQAAGTAPTTTAMTQLLGLGGTGMQALLTVNLANPSHVPGDNSLTLGGVFLVIDQTAPPFPAYFDVRFSSKTGGPSTMHRTIPIALNATYAAATAGTAVTVNGCSTTGASMNIQNMCAALGGTFNLAATPQCSLPAQTGSATITGGSCTTPGQYVVSIGSTGIPSCATPSANLTGGPCAAGQIVTAISTSGIPTCTPISTLYAQSPPPAPPAPPPAQPPLTKPYLCLTYYMTPVNHAGQTLVNLSAPFLSATDQTSFNFNAQTNIQCTKIQ